MHMARWIMALLLTCTILHAQQDLLQPHLTFDRLSLNEGLSQTTVDVIFQGKDGFLWIGTEDGLNRFDGYGFKVYRKRMDMQPGLTSSTISALAQHDMLYVGTQFGGLNSMNPHTGIIEPMTSPMMGQAIAALAVFQGQLWVASNKGLVTYHLQEQTWRAVRDANGIQIQQVQSLWVDGETLWVATDVALYRVHAAGMEQVHTVSGNPLVAVRGVARLGEEIWAITANQLWVSQDGKSFRRLRSFDESLRCVVADKRDRLWLGTSNGLLCFHTHSGRLARYREPQLSSDHIRSLFLDRGGVLWIGTLQGGLNRFNAQLSFANGMVHDPANEKSLLPGAVMAFSQDQQERLWIGTTNGLSRRDDSGFTHYRGPQAAAKGLQGDIVWSLHEDINGVLWVGTDVGLNRYLAQSDAFRLETSDEASSLGSVWDIADRPEGGLLVATTGGLGALAVDGRGLLPIYADRDQPFSAICLAYDRGQRLWVGTYAKGVRRYDPGRDQPKIYRAQAGDHLGLAGNQINDILVDKQGEVWIATTEGLSRYLDGEDRFQTYREAAGLPSNQVLALLEDDEHLWLATYNGLARFDREKESFVAFGRQHGLLTREFNLGAVYGAKDGTLYFGNVDGYNWFRPDGIRRNTYQAPLVITNLKRNGETVPTDRPSGQMPMLNVSHRDVFVSLEWSILDYTAFAKPEYAYRLDREGSNWINMGTRRYVNLSRPEAGRYRFQVRAVNGDGLPMMASVELPLTVSPAPWFSPWAYLLYAVLAGLAVWVYVIVQRRKLQQQRKINERLRRVDRLKDDFLANTSHELRTPLNGIIGIVESLMDGVAGPIGDRAREHLSYVHYSGRRLASLVDDILDFSKLKNHSVELHKKSVQPHTLAEIVFTLSQPLIGDKPIDLINDMPTDLPPVLGDEARLVQILHNLVDNAIKFTKRGRVTVKAVVDGDMLRLEVADTGIGIADSHLGRIFESFEQVDGSDTRRYGGTGLGLAITKRLVQLHGGQIWVDSQQNQGSRFMFTLPLAPVDAKPATALIADDFRAERSIECSPMPGQLVQGDGQFTILVVDDDPVNRQVLINHLQAGDFQLLEAESGEAALAIFAAQPTIDLVLLDIMMPTMSGHQVCKALRKQRDVNDLPIIFLTAKTQPDDRVTGLEMGANDYITKPVSKNELVARVRTHLQLLDINRTLERKVVERTRALKIRNQELTTLNKIVKAINREIHLENVLRRLLEQGLYLFPRAQNGVFFIWDDVDGVFCIAAAAGYTDVPIKELEFDYHELVERYTRNVRELEPGIFLMTATEELPAAGDFRHFPRPQSLLAMAVRDADRIVGFLVLDNVDEAGAFNRSDGMRLKRFHEHAVSAVLKARMLRELQLKNEEILRTQKQMVMQEKMASLGTLTAGIAHEIKNPLNFVNNFAEICCEMAADLRSELAALPAEQHKVAQRLAHIIDDLVRNADLIQRHGRRADGIVQSMMSLSQAKPAKRELRNMNDLVDEYGHLAYQGRRLKDKRVPIHFQRHFDPSVGELEVVPQNLGRVLINLVNNAYDAVQRKAETALGDFRPTLWLETENLGDGVEIRVRDNGTGIDPEHREKIFTPFFSTKSGSQGNVGLGLAICYDIITQEHFGDIDIRSEVGAFTEFVVFLPRSRSFARRSAESFERV